MRKKVVTILLTSTLFATSCGGKTPAEKLQPEIKTIASFMATVDWVTAAQANASVPAAYASRTINVAQQNLQDEQTTIRSFDVSQDYRDQLTTILDQVIKTLPAIRQAFETRDSNAMNDEITVLAIQRQALDALSKRLEVESAGR
ncbi:MAG: hypothetical protein ABR555_17770 [Pyrinomonadaceae bacterium]